MPLIKYQTRYISVDPTKKALQMAMCAQLPSFENALQEGMICAQHPSLMLAMKALEDYERWVSQVVMPIVFQWIHENHKLVYDKIPKELWDDVGVVIARAFDLVKEMEAFKESREMLAKMESKMPFDANAINPVWRATSEKLEQEMQDAFKAETEAMKEPTLVG